MATETFSAFIDGAPTATSLLSTDYLPVVRSGATLKLAGSSIGTVINATPSNVFTPDTADFAVASSASFVVQVSTGAASTPEFAAAFQLSAATGAANVQKSAVIVGTLASTGCYDANGVVSTCEVATANSTTNLANGGYFSMLNNNAVAPFGGSLTYNGVSIVSSGAFRATSGLSISGPWYNGITINGSSASAAAILDSSSASNGLQFSGGVHFGAAISYSGAEASYGIDFVGATALPSGAIRLYPNISGAGGIYYRNLGNTSDFVALEAFGMGGGTATQLAGGDQLVVAVAANLYPGFNFNPIWNVGGGSANNTWDTIYCVSLVQTSSESTKDVVDGPLPDVEAIVRALDLKLYRFKKEGADVVVGSEEYDDHLSAPVTRQVSRVEVVNGAPQIVTRSVTTDELQYDEQPVIGPDGKPVMRVVPGQPAIVDPRTGAVIQAGTPATQTPLIHRQPIMVKKTRPTKSVSSADGTRLRIGPMAANIKHAWETVGGVVGTAAHRASDDGAEFYDVAQHTWLALATIQRLTARIEALEAKVGK